MSTLRSLWQRSASRAFQLLVPFLLGTAATAVVAANTLAIAPVSQQTPAWCWLASSQMIFSYWNIPAYPNPYNSYQCGILLAAGMQCNSITAGQVGPPDNVIANVLHAYPILVQRAYPQMLIQQLQSGI